MAISEKRRGLCVVQRAAAEQVQKHASFTWRSGVRVSQLYGLPSHRIYTTDNTNNTDPVTVSTRDLLGSMPSRALCDSADWRQ
ncbi:unnamed protein product [Boreogadus saida]